ncbi:MAG: DNA polymerase/3'-5' exonuclease PolX [Chloroflexi bacterium]|nr:DNA polymerase/3'-5' exonuclease PolX [Chloroflexota bacterium]
MTEARSNRAIADLFLAIADRMEILGEDRFRLLAYRRAGEAIADLPMPLADYRARDALEQIPGIGKTIAEKIGVILDSGTLPLAERLRSEVPDGVLELLRVPELGPSRVARLYRELGIASLEQLRAALEAGQLRGLKGFGAKSEERIRQGLASLAEGERRILLGPALATAELLLAELRAALPDLAHLAYTGSLRRARPTVGDIDLLAAAADTAAVTAAFVALPQVTRILAQGEVKASVLLHSGLRADLLVVAPARWGSALQHFTGSKEHNIHIRRLAQEQGYSFSEQGFARADGTLLECATEEQVYATLGLAYIPPELREDAGEIEAAAAGRLPTLIAPEALLADLHMHSRWSDGRATIAEMAAAAEARGLRYIAITDHSAYLGVTGGLDAARLHEQAAEVAAVNAAWAARGSPFRVLHGVEVDITPDGSLALPDAALAGLDLVIASLHVSLRQPREQVTARLLQAIANPHVDLIAHPTGRILNRRPGADLDMEAVLRAAATHGTILEINSGPERLDLDAGHVRRALELGVDLAINSDAHQPDELAWTRLGVLTARRGWTPAERVVNTWPLERLLARLRS